MRTRSLNFYFDPISPYAWLAFSPLQALAAKHEMELSLRPVLFAGLLNAHGQLGPAEIPSKRSYIMKDVARRASYQGLTLNPPSKHPFRPLMALRVCSIIGSDQDRAGYVKNLLDAVWSRGKDVSDREVLAEVIDRSNLNSSMLLGLILKPEVKEILRKNTEEAVKKGVFGVPTTEVEERDNEKEWHQNTPTDQDNSPIVSDPNAVHSYNELFWGSDRDTMHQIDLALSNEDKVYEYLPNSDSRKSVYIHGVRKWENDVVPGSWRNPNLGKWKDGNNPILAKK